jgi:hypothetical protein
VIGVGVGVAVLETDVHKGWLRGGGIVLGFGLGMGCWWSLRRSLSGEKIGSGGAVVFDLRFLCVQHYTLH